MVVVVVEVLVVVDVVATTVVVVDVVVVSSALDPQATKSKLSARERGIKRFIGERPLIGRQFGILVRGMMPRSHRRSIRLGSGRTSGRIHPDRQRVRAHNPSAFGTRRSSSGLSHLLSSTDNLVAIGGLYTLGVPFNGDTPSHMKKPKGVFSRLFNRRSGVETEAPDLSDLTAHLAIDLDAISSRAGEPAFMAPPAGAQPYYGFQLLPEVEVSGFILGTITDFLRHQNLDTGDGFIQAPDGSRAGLEWRMSSEPYVLMMAPPTANRWGVWMVGFTHRMDSLDAALANLTIAQPALEDRWRRWHEARSQNKFD